MPEVEVTTAAGPNMIDPVKFAKKQESCVVTPAQMCHHLSNPKLLRLLECDITWTCMMIMQIGIQKYYQCISNAHVEVLNNFPGRACCRHGCNSMTRQLLLAYSVARPIHKGPYVAVAGGQD